MYIRELVFRNVGPYGNNIHTFNFEGSDDVGKLIQVLGKNGVGKSFFLKIIKLGLYLETDGMLISEVSNDINGDGYISVTYDSKGNTWKNESVYGKSKLKTIQIYKNGSEKPEDYGGNQDTKRILVEQILDMPYYIFNNAISLSVNDFKSFLSMDAKDTRNIRDRIFGFFIVNEMIEIIRKTLNKHTQQQQDILISLKNLSESITTTTTQYNEAKEKIDAADTENLKALNEELKGYQTRHDEVKKELEENQTKLDNWNLVLEYLDNESNKKELELMKTKETQLAKSIENTENDVVSKEDEIKLLNSERDILVLKTTKERVDTMKKDIINIQSKLTNLKEKESLAKQNMDDMENSISEMNTSNENASIVNNLVSSVNTISNLQTVHQQFIAKKQELANTKESISNNKKSVEAEVTELESESKQLTDRKELIESGKCDRCHTDLTTNDFVEEKSKIGERLSEIETIITNKNKLIETIDQSETENDGFIKEIDNNITNSTADISSAVTLMMSIAPEQKNEKLTPIRTFVLAINNEKFADIEAFKKLINETKLIVYSDDKITESQVKLDKLKKEYEKANEEYTTTNETVISKKSSIDTLSEQLNNVDEEQLKKELKFSDKSKYDTEIDTNTKEAKSKGEILTGLNKQHASIGTEIKNVEKSIKPEDKFKNINAEYIQTLAEIKAPDDVLAYINGTLESINDDITELNTKSSNLNDNIISTNTSINNINKQKDETQLESIQKIIDDFQLKYNEHEKNNELLQKKVDFIKVLEYVLSDECVKAYMLREIVPTINNEIANMLMALGVNLTVIFNDEFKPTIYRFGNKASLSSISTGQKKMIDESILMSITILILMRYGKFNLVLYDEIFSSLHATMIPIMLELIKEKLCRKLKLNVILINHSYMSSSYFDEIVHIYHKDNFSFMDIMKPDDYERMELVDIEENG